MKFVLIFCFSMLLSACASLSEVGARFQRATNRSGMTQSEWAAHVRAVEERERADKEAQARLEEVRAESERQWRDKRRAAKAAIAEKKIKKGSSRDLIQDLWGQPDRTTNIESGFFDWYDDPVEPMFFLYGKNSKLFGWAVDEELIQKRKEEARIAAHEERLRAIEEKYEQQLHQARHEQARAEQRQAWQNFGNSLQNMNNQSEINRLKYQQQNQQTEINRLQNQNYNGPVKVNQPGR